VRTLGWATVRSARCGKIMRAVERDPLIRVVVLSDMLRKALEELDDGRFTSSQLLEQLRDVGDRAQGELSAD